MVPAISPPVLSILVPVRHWEEGLKKKEKKNFDLDLKTLIIEMRRHTHANIKL